MLNFLLLGGLIKILPLHYTGASQDIAYNSFILKLMFNFIIVTIDTTFHKIFLWPTF